MVAARHARAPRLAPQPATDNLGQTLIVRFPRIDDHPKAPLRETPVTMPSDESDLPQQPLFRNEALDAKRGQWLGPINLATSKTQRLLGLAALVFFVASCLLLTLGQYSRRMTLKGTLVEGQASNAIQAKRDAYLCALLIQEGQRVERNAPLAQISTVPCDTAPAEDWETLRAATDGFVAGVGGLSAPSRVLAGQRLLTIRQPTGTLVASLSAPEQVAGYVGEGDAISLRIDALPFQKFGTAPARVVGLRQRWEDPASGGKPGYEIHASLDAPSLRLHGEDVPLRQGMRISSSIVLETRRLYEWIYEPLYLRRMAQAGKAS